MVSHEASDQAKKTPHMKSEQNLSGAGSRNATHDLMVARYVVGFTLFAIPLAFAQNERSQRIRGMPAPIHSERKSKLELEQLRANPPLNWAVQKRAVDEALFVQNLENAIHPAAVIAARKKYPTLMMAWTTMAEAEDAWELLAWKDDEFLQIRAKLAAVDECLANSPMIMGFARQWHRPAPVSGGHLTQSTRPNSFGSYLERHIAWSTELETIEQRLSNNDEARPFFDKREKARETYRGMLVKLEEIIRKEEEKARVARIEAFRKEREKEMSGWRIDEKNIGPKRAVPTNKHANDPDRAFKRFYRE